MAKNDRVELLIVVWRDYMTGYVGNIEEITKANTNFRKVVYTGIHTQLVVMSLEPSEEIGVEKHDRVDQFFRVESGKLKIVIDGDEHILTDGVAAIVPAGAVHNVINIGSDTAKLYTLYSPPNHPDGTVHMTKADAMVGEKTTS